MYLHLGQNTVIMLEDIIGVFDLDTSTISKHTRNFLAKSEINKKVINISSELPKSFILCQKESGTIKVEKVFISPLASLTLLKRQNKDTGDIY